jgi:ribonuclease HI
MKNPSMRIEIYTDGACSGNPGKGGYGIVMRVPEKNYQKTFSKGFRKTTNNRMELLAVITALEKLKSTENDIHVFTDSKYVSDAINQNWISGWIKRGWKNVKNPDLWQKFVVLYNQHNPKMHWIKGHAGHFENELCDKLAVAAAASNNLEIDTYFEGLEKNSLF